MNQEICSSVPARKTKLAPIFLITSSELNDQSKTFLCFSWILEKKPFSTRNILCVLIGSGGAQSPNNTRRHRKDLTVRDSPHFYSRKPSQFYGFIKRFFYYLADRAETCRTFVNSYKKRNLNEYDFSTNNSFFLNHSIDNDSFF